MKRMMNIRDGQRVFLGWQRIASVLLTFLLFSFSAIGEAAGKKSVAATTAPLSASAASSVGGKSSKLAKTTATSKTSKSEKGHPDSSAVAKKKPVKGATTLSTANEAANANAAAQNLGSTLGMSGAASGGGNSGAAPSLGGQKPLEIRGQVRRLNMSLVLKDRSGDIDFVKERKNYREEILAQTMK